MIARALAALQGCGAARLATSTLHVFWDLFPILGGEGGVAIHINAEAYPISRPGVERAVSRGAPVRSFPHHDAERFERAARAADRRGLRLERGMRTCFNRPTAGPRLSFLITARAIAL
jgi:hypothetical protein